MELPDPYLPGAISLLDQLDKKLIVVLRDGRKLIGYLRSIDQFANLILDEVVERTFCDKFYSDIRHGFLLIRGENVVLAGEIDETLDTGLKEITGNEMTMLQEERSRHHNRKHDLPKAEPQRKTKHADMDDAY